MAGWKIPEVNGGSNRKITDVYGPFSIAMFDDQKVYNILYQYRHGPI